MIVPVILAGMFGTSHGQPAGENDAKVEGVKLLLQAEQLEKEGMYAACANAYWRLYEGSAGAPMANDVLLYNAGVCYENARG